MWIVHSDYNIVCNGKNIEAIKLRFNGGIDLYNKLSHQNPKIKNADWMRIVEVYRIVKQPVTKFDLENLYTLDTLLDVAYTSCLMIGM